MKLLSTVVVALGIAACSGSVEHSGGPVGVASVGGAGVAGLGGGGAGTAGTGGSGTGTAGLGTGTAGFGMDGGPARPCASSADCPVPELCLSCADGSVACARAECLNGACVDDAASCGAVDGGAADGSGGISDACQTLLANVYQALTEAQACSDAPGQCQTMVREPCGCDVPVANDAFSYTTFYYQAALSQLNAANCSYVCPGTGCLQSVRYECVLGDAGRGVCGPI